MAERWTVDETQKILDDVFAPWVRALGLQVVAVGETGILMRLPGNPDIVRGGGPGGGIVCGQAVAAAADTGSVVMLGALNGAFRPCTTVDLTTHFMRPLPEGDVEIEITALSMGRRMATSRAEFRAPGGKIAASATCAFAFLDV
ncbi:MAG: PaaI family thioesterase [Alphaproteobacteria bacterium]